MKCRQCGHENREHARFCDQCGSVLPVHNEEKKRRYQEQCIWYYEKFGIQKGPFTPEELDQMVKASVLSERITVYSHSGKKEKAGNVLNGSSASRKQPESGWYVSREGKTLGPYSRKKTEEMIAAGIFKVSDLYLAPDAGRFLPGKKTVFKDLFKTGEHHETEAAEVLWYISENGQSRSIEKKDLIQMVADGKLSAADPVWNSIEKKWRRVDETELSQYIPLNVMQDSRNAGSWFIRHHQKVHGPYSEEQIANSIARQEIAMDAQVRKSDTNDFASLEKSRFLPLLRRKRDGWYILENERAAGPVSAADLIQKIQSGEVHTGMLFYQSSMDGWKPLEDILPVLKKQRQSAAAEKNRKKNTDAWYIGVHNTSQGPYTSSQIQKFYQEGMIQNATYVWKPGMENWIAYKESPLYLTRIPEKEWYYVENGKSTGPFTREEMKEFYYNQTLDDFSWVWKEGMKDWQAYQDSQLAY